MLFQKIQKNSKILLTKQIICVIVLPVPSGFPLTILFDIRRSTQVGRRGAPAKGVGRILTGARVQISPSPPFKSTTEMLWTFALSLICTILLSLSTLSISITKKFNNGLEIKFNINMKTENLIMYFGLSIISVLGMVPTCVSVRGINRRLKRKRKLIVLQI